MARSFCGEVADRSVEFLRSIAVPISLFVAAMLLWAASPLGLVILGGLMAWWLVRWRVGEPVLCDGCAHHHPARCNRPERGSATLCAGFEPRPQGPPPRGLVVSFDERRRRASGDDE